MTQALTTPNDFSSGIPVQNNSFFVGTFASQKVNATANSTVNAAHALWHFAQTWFAEFPPYKPSNNKISIWTESVCIPTAQLIPSGLISGFLFSQYGGKYGPVFTAFFDEQNEKIVGGSTSYAGAIELHLDTLGIVNGWYVRCFSWLGELYVDANCSVDTLTQALSYPQIAYNNTYGIEGINSTVYRQAIDDFSKPGGCKDKLIECRTLAAQYDKDGVGNVPQVNAACGDADTFCFTHLTLPYIITSNRGYYDMGHVNPDPFPPQYLLGYLSQHWVQGALGVPVNFTASARPIYTAFTATADPPRGGVIEDIGFILDRGIKVALVYGDRDYLCNWIGGEEVSLAVDYYDQQNFKRAGYAPVQVSNGYVGGLVRQFGNFSFTRVFEAGHEVPSYQPETAYEIFRRAIFGKDIATGEVSISEDCEYSSQGPSSTWQVKNAIPPDPKPTCYILDPSTCTGRQLDSVYFNEALIHNYIVQDGESSAPQGNNSQYPA
ncbi:hypothetical protein GP486_002407 [Trichoglossum hirsutum]|uniref:Carboxypeptidase S1 n=1 Tax=Trichoglossum hirsutum TaxID=265104 RepID=A0A9P8RS45_9PEZI|nr:hypothetical protein GP486_002407 [Trichoglossum hirsutum]